jgi:PAS domain S-box-containing protein
VNRRIAGEIVNDPRTYAIEALGRRGRFLAPLFATENVGIAIIDETFRFQAINALLAAINGFPTKSHVGKTLRQILGPVADEVEPRITRTYETGENLIFEVQGRLPTRRTLGHWVDTCVPMKDSRNKVVRVCIIVFEVTGKKRLEESLFGLTGKLLYLNSSLRRKLDGLSGNPSHQLEEDSELRHSVDLIEKCTADIMDVLKTIRPSSSLISKKLLDISNSFSDVPKVSLPLSDNLPPRRISQREREVLQLLASNKSNKEAALALGISVRTVESHRRRIMEKLGLHSASELIHFAIRNGIVEA